LQVDNRIAVQKRRRPAYASDGEPNLVAIWLATVFGYDDVSALDVGVRGFVKLHLTSSPYILGTEWVRLVGESVAGAEKHDD
jgi:hypothetical protein